MRKNKEILRSGIRVVILNPSVRREQQAIVIPDKFAVTISSTLLVIFQYLSIPYHYDLRMASNFQNKSSFLKRCLLISLLSRGGTYVCLTLPSPLNSHTVFMFLITCCWISAKNAYGMSKPEPDCKTFGPLPQQGAVDVHLVNSSGS